MKIKILKKQSDILVKTYLDYENFVKNTTEEQKLDEKYIIKNTIKIFYEVDEDTFNQLPYTAILDMYKIIS